MLKKILLQSMQGLLEVQDSECYQTLLKEACKNNVEIRILPRVIKDIATFVSSEEYPDTLIVTDQVRILKEAEKAHMARIAVLASFDNGVGLFRAEYAVEDVSGLDYFFIHMVYNRYHKIPLEIIRTSRCIVREMSAEDTNELKILYQESASEYLQPLSDAELERDSILSYSRSMYGFYGYGLWLVLERSTGKVIGRIGFENLLLDDWRIEEGHAAARVKREIQNRIVMTELGYMISKKYQRRGFAWEVCLSLISFFDTNFGTGHLYIRIEPGNTASIKLAEKLGFAFTSQIERQGKVMLLYQYVLRKP